MNWKAWDNNAAACGATVKAFVGPKRLWEIMVMHDKRFGVFRPHASVCAAVLRGNACGLCDQE